MTCNIIGGGLVGSFLGAAARSPQVLCGQSGRYAASRVMLPLGTGRGQLCTWEPQRCADINTDLPTLVCTRIQDTPTDLPADCLGAQNGISHRIPTIACFIAVDIEDDGVLHFQSAQPRLTLSMPSPRWQAVVDAWRASGIIVDCVSIADAARAQWEKMLLNACVGPLCLITGKTMGGVWNDPALRQRCQHIIAEGVAIAAQSSAPETLDTKDLQRCAATLFAHIGSHRPSALNNPHELFHILQPLHTAVVSAPNAFPETERLLTELAVRISETTAAAHHGTSHA